MSGNKLQAVRDLEQYISINGNKDNLQAEAERLIKDLERD
jgi:hypothetical protein